jgi:hypothetical protein
MEFKDDSRTKLLFAQLNRALQLGDFIRDLNVDYSRLKLNSTIIRNDKTGALRMFSGVFFTGSYSSAAPFCIGFYGGEKSHINNMALPTHRGVQSLILSYLSFIDYLCDMSELKGPLQRYNDHITLYGKNEARTRYAAEYPAFKIRAAKDLPYDLSLEFLGVADKAAA